MEPGVVHAVERRPIPPATGRRRRRSDASPTTAPSFDIRAWSQESCTLSNEGLFLRQRAAAGDVSEAAVRTRWFVSVATNRLSTSVEGLSGGAVASGSESARAAAGIRLASPASRSASAPIKTGSHVAQNSSISAVRPGRYCCRATIDPENRSTSAQYAKSGPTITPAASVRLPADSHRSSTASSAESL